MRFRREDAAAMSPYRDPVEATVTEINRTIEAKFETYPELDVGEILRLCRPSILDLLRRALRENTQATIHEVRTRILRDE
jgi:hypothetical protein